MGRQWTANPPFTSSNLVAASILPRVLLLTAALALTAAGYLFGDPLVILSKAVNVCLECIGVG